ncbi:MAG: hypothetical protein NZ455_02845 [Bacteroidia bacterium]|nr:hypothetical protein [Bacteroidia bacterium]
MSGYELGFFTILVFFWAFRMALMPHTTRTHRETTKKIIFLFIFILVI